MTPGQMFEAIIQKTSGCDAARLVPTNDMVA